MISKFNGSIASEDGRPVLLEGNGPPFLVAYASQSGSEVKLSGKDMLIFASEEY